MTWWVLTYYYDHTTPTTWRHIASTNNPDHLFMKWSTIKPHRSRILRTIRGKYVFCGYKYYWNTPNLAEQIEHGDTTLHNFHIDNLQPGSTIWFYLFAPYGPYDREIQGPLSHVTLPLIYDWAPRVFVATQAKGAYSTQSFTGPEGPQCTWQPISAGLLDPNIYQLHGDLYDPHSRHYCITQGDHGWVVYRRQPAVSNAWIPLLTDPMAAALCGTPSGQIRWLTTNFNRPGYLYALFNAQTFTTGNWCLRSPDYGDTWTAHQIIDVDRSYKGGMLMCGLAQGSSPYPAGDVIYATYTVGPIGWQGLSASFDNGTTWNLRDSKGAWPGYARTEVDPTDQSIVYMGSCPDTPPPARLWRSEQHGNNLIRADLPHDLGTLLTPYPSPIWIHPTNNALIKILRYTHLWQTWDYGATWENLGATQILASRMTIPDPLPGFYYFGRIWNGSQPPPGSNPHVLFISEDHGATMIAKSGRNPELPAGGGNSIPFDCGGIALDGILPIY